MIWVEEEGKLQDGGKDEDSFFCMACNSFLSLTASLFSQMTARNVIEVGSLK